MENVVYSQIDKNLIISWMLPCQPNGEIEHFILSWNNSNERQAKSYSPSQELIKATTNQFGYSYQLTEIKPETKYSFVIRAESGRLKGEEYKWDVTTDPEGEFLFSIMISHLNLNFPSSWNEDLQTIFTNHGNEDRKRSNNNSIAPKYFRVKCRRGEKNSVFHFATCKLSISYQN